MRRWF